MGKGLAYPLSEDPSLIPRAQVQSQEWSHMLVVPALEADSSAEPDCRPGKDAISKNKVDREMAPWARALQLTA